MYGILEGLIGRVVGEVGCCEPRGTVRVGDDRIVGVQEVVKKVPHLAEEIDGEGEEHDAGLVGVVNDE